MITKEIARLIFNSHSEIENALRMIEEIRTNLNEKGEFKLTDTWGDVRGDLQLHIPARSAGSYSVKGVRAEVAIKVLHDHIEDHKKELERLKGVCQIQLA
jgi:hypothetical protein